MAGKRARTVKCTPPCKRKFRSWVGVQDHIRTNDRHPDRAYCKQCRMWLADHEELRKHNHNDVPQSQTGWTSGFNGRTYSSWYDWQQYLASAVHNFKIVVCKPCGMLFDKKSELQTHLQNAGVHRHDGKLAREPQKHPQNAEMHTKDSKQIHVTCKPCGIWFEKVSELKKHFQNAELYQKHSKQVPELRKHPQNAEVQKEDSKCGGETRGVKPSQQVHKENHHDPANKKQKHPDAAFSKSSAQLNEYTSLQAHDEDFKAYTTINYKRCDIFFENQQGEKYHLEAPSQNWRCPEPNCSLDCTSKDSHIKAAHCFRCPFCRKALSDTQFDGHLDDSHPRCWPCDKRFSTASEFHRHKAGNSNHLWCSVCSVEIGSNVLLQGHYEQCHPSLYCQKCRIISPESGGMLRHLEQSSEHFWCRKCGEDFYSSDALAQHMAKASGDGSGRHWYCIQCSEDFDSQAERHGHYIASDCHQYCRVCQALFQTKDILRAHYMVKAMQNLKTHFMCPTCDKELGDRHEVLEHHLRLHLSSTDCGIFLVRRHNNEGSQSPVNTKDGIHHYCEDCDTRFWSETDLEVHWLRNWASHHYCSQCSRKFRTADGLKGHFKASPSIHNFCPSCDATFWSPDKLEQHTKRMHAAAPGSSDTTALPGPSDTSASVDSDSEDDFGHNLPKPEQRHNSSTTNGKKGVICICWNVFPTTSQMFEHCEKGGCCLRPSELQDYVRKKDVYGLFTTENSSAQYQHRLSAPLLKETMNHESTPRHQVEQFVCPRNACKSAFHSFSLLINHLDGSACGEWIWAYGRKGLGFLRKYIA